MILEPNRGVPFDAFVRPYVEAQLGTFVSFGDPADVVYRSGARRHYVTDTRWQSLFEEFLPRTTAFLAVATTLSKGFIWELTRLRELDLHTCLFLFTPPSPEPRSKPLVLRAYECAGRMFWPHLATPDAEDSWQHAALNLRPIGYQLTEYPGPGAVIGFAPDGASVILARNCKEPGEFISPVRRVLFSSSSSTRASPMTVVPDGRATSAPGEPREHVVTHILDRDADGDGSPALALAGTSSMASGTAKSDGA